MFKRLVFTLMFVAGFNLPARSETLVGLMSDKTLRHFSSTAPGAFTKTVNLSGIPAAEAVTALDFRPDNSLLVATLELNTVRFYFVDPNSGAATLSPFQLTAGNITVVAFDAFAPDVHPTDLVMTAGEVDFLTRFSVTPSGFDVEDTKDLRYDSTSSAGDGDPPDENAGVNPFMVAFASTNGFPGAQDSVLYGIDTTPNCLVRIEWATGQMDTIGTLRNAANATVLIESRTGFDISGTTGIAYLMNGSGDLTRLLRVDLTSGLTTDLGRLGPAPSPTSPDMVDISVLAPTRLANISTRSRVGTGQDVMIAGFIAQGAAPARFIVRGIGPSLQAAGVATPLSDPVLTLFDGNGVQIATNDNWKSTQQTEIEDTGIPPTNDLEAAFVGTFSPGAFTAILSGKNGGTGVGLIEVFRLPDL